MEQETNVLHDFNEPEYEFATTGQRFLNYVIDLIAFYLLVTIVFVIIGFAYASSGEVIESESGGFIALTYLISFAIIFAYYTLLEGSKGKTLGKLITKTKVVREDGEPMTFGKAFMRTLCRLIPFEFISAFTGTKMWHDSWSNTMTVKDR